MKGSFKKPPDAQRLPSLNSRHIVAGISSPSARSCRRTGSRSPSIARWQIRRASSLGLILPLPLVLRVIHASSKAVRIETIEHRGTSRELLDQRSNQAQHLLLLWSVASRDAKGSALNVRDPPT